MLQFKNVTKHYDSKAIYGLSHISFKLTPQKITCLAGPSGSGKSTLMKLITGEEVADKGEITLPPEMNFSYVPSSPEIPWEKTVFEYVEEPVMFIDEQERRVNQVRLMLSQFELTNEMKRPLKAISQGQLQRATIARAFVKNPNTILLDEPFQHLDKHLRFEFMKQLVELSREKEVTLLWITHDLDEALPFCDEIMLLEQGELRAKGNPQEIYFNPPNLFSAQFLGTRNILSAQKKNETSFELLGLNFPLPEKKLENFFLVMIDPSKISFVNESSLPARVVNSYFYGDYYLIEVECKNQIILVKTQTSMDKDSVFLEMQSSCFHYLSQI